jgi:predicted DNA-binding protein (MmcQ/YjbR family)
MPGLRLPTAAGGPRHWNTITVDGSLPGHVVADLPGDSYDLVVASLPKARRPA